MPKSFFLMLCALTLMFLASDLANAQHGRPSVSVTEVTGTFRHSFPAKFKGSSSDIKIQSVGRGKLKVAFDLVYPHLDGRGRLTANTGEASGNAAINGDTAVYESKEFGQCKITIKFVRPGRITVSQEGTDGDCGFGHNVMANGTYRKVSSKKPKFDKNH